MPRSPAAREEERTVELCVRSLSETFVQAQQRSAIDRLAELSAAGAIDAFDIQVWGRQLVLSATTIRTDSGRRFLDRFKRIRTWAAGQDVSLAPFFEVREISAELTDEEFTVVAFPVSALVEYVDGEIVSVTPHRTENQVYSVPDRLADLEATVPEAALEPAEADRSGQRSDLALAEPKPDR
jgi:hypothetical protein